MEFEEVFLSSQCCDWYYSDYCRSERKFASY